MAKGAKKTEAVLLSSGNPQVPKGEGDAPVQAYLDALPGWKQAVLRRVDELIVETVPDVAKAVKWNTPLYGNEGDGWFLSLYTYRSFVQVAFLRGTSLDPMPPGESKTPETRYLKVSEGDELDEAQLVDWIEQAAKLPGEHL